MDDLFIYIILQVAAALRVVIVFTTRDLCILYLYSTESSAKLLTAKSLMDIIY